MCFKSANTDITYCVNKNCNQRNDCFRCLENYKGISDTKWYCFTEFNEETCNKGIRKD